MDLYRRVYVNRLQAISRLWPNAPDMPIQDIHDLVHATVIDAAISRSMHSEILPVLATAADDVIGHYLALNQPTSPESAEWLESLLQAELQALANVLNESNAARLLGLRDLSRRLA